MILADRSIRLLIAVALFLFAFSMADGGWRIVSFIVACIMAATAILGVCPLYTLLGIGTRPARRNKKQRSH